VPIVLKSGSSTPWKPYGLSGPVMGLLYIYFYLITSVDGQHLVQVSLLPGKKPGTQSIGGLVGPSFGLDECGVEKVLVPSPGFESRNRITCR